MPKLTPAQMKAAVEEFKKKFTGGFYHGSPSPNITAFDPLKSKVRDVDFVTPGVTFVTKSPNFADSFTNGKGPYISLKTGDAVPAQAYTKGATMYPVSVDLTNHFDPTTPEGFEVVREYVAKKYADNPEMAAKFKSRILDPNSNWTTMESPSFLQHLRDTGHTSFAVNEAGYPNVGVLDPSKIRGKFAKYNPEDAESADFMKAEGGPVQHYDGGGKVNLAIKLAKQFAPKFSLEAIEKMPVGSATKQTPVAKAFQLLSSENVDSSIKKKIFQDYVAKHPELVKQSGATNYDELTQAAYEKMRKETKDQFDLMTGSGIKLSWDPTGEKGYKSSADMLKDAAENKHLTVFQGGEPHPMIPNAENEAFRAVHDYFGHGTTGSSFGPKGEELAYGAHSQMYSPLARLAAATETRGQNSFVNYSGINDELIKKMNEARARGASPEELQKLGQQWQYAPQKGLILPPEQIDINYPGYAPGGVVKKALEHARTLPFVHYSPQPSLTYLEPQMYGKGIKGAEAARLKNAPDIKPRSYFYVDQGANTRQPEVGLGPHKYAGVAEDIYPLHEDPAGFSAIAKQKAIDPYLASKGIIQANEQEHLNELERLIKNAGYRGYANDDVGLLFHPTEVQKISE